MTKVLYVCENEDSMRILEELNKYGDIIPKSIVSRVVKLRWPNRKMYLAILDDKGKIREKITDFPKIRQTLFMRANPQQQQGQQRGGRYAPPPDVYGNSPSNKGPYDNPNYEAFMYEEMMKGGKDDEGESEIAERGRDKEERDKMLMSKTMSMEENREKGKKEKYVPDPHVDNEFNGELSKEKLEEDLDEYLRNIMAS